MGGARDGDNRARKPAVVTGTSLAFLSDHGDAGAGDLASDHASPRDSLRPDSHVAAQRPPSASSAATSGLP